ncbi:MULTISPECIES: ABC transporter permease [Microbacterium]|uniref:ABC transporter permease n=1 Tax=Microbacterium TaxID=33882 RepID=UPI00278625A4|nr:MULTISPECIES: ABC transporter permease [Microbacterium]MDQ1083159.1 ABC-2 type transport system permease protein [Microbacterium sp. SORGH_AS_0344]MDQ1171566.1 ABC-2 type transport system permease protein [Microbacterium proteolyticum]
MIGVIRSEFLRARSGANTLAVLLLGAFIPVIVLTSDDTLGRITSMDAATTTSLLLAPLAWSFVVAGFAGAFGVTREFYYGSMGRTIAQIGFRRAFIAKGAASIMSAIVLTTGIAAAWCGGAAIVLKVNGLAFAPSVEAIRTVLGAFPGAVFGAILGSAVGWIIGNYYAAAAIALAGPIAFEMGFLGSAPDVARFSPGLSLAALASPSDHPVLLDPWIGLVVALGWTVVLTAAGWVVGRRRFQ